MKIFDEQIDHSYTELFKKMSWPDTNKLKSSWKEIRHRTNIEPSNYKTYQLQVNAITKDIFKLCLAFEARKPSHAQLILAKKWFISEFRDFVREGSLNRMVMDRPYGYPGDFRIIDHIYQKDPKTLGFERCMDDHLLDSPASIATRNRKEDFKNYLIRSIKKLTGEIHIMNLASGPCRDISELLKNHKQNSIFFEKKLIIDCLDHDTNALTYGKTVLSPLLDELTPNILVRFIKKNALRISLAKNIEKYIQQKYDIIYSTGLFDYLGGDIAVALLENLKLLLKPNGILIISNYREGFRNLSRVFMDWGVDWQIVYRSQSEFTGLFEKAGFRKSSLQIEYEHQGIMQYCFAKNN